MTPAVSSAPPAARAGAVHASPEAYRWVYLWHWPIRVMHWVSSLAIVVLFWTGLYLGRPYFMGAIGGSFVIQYARLIHFIAAGALVAAAIVRFYWLFVGNRYERWQALFPVFRRDWKHLWMMLRYYLFIHPEQAPKYLGHNPLQQIFATLTYVVSIVMILTGFLLYTQANPAGWMGQMIGWMTPLLGGNQTIRMVHHVLPWYYPVFVIVHSYLAIRHDSLEHAGTLSSMVSGGRFIRAGEQHVDE